MLLFSVHTWLSRKMGYVDGKTDGDLLLEEADVMEEKERVMVLKVPCKRVSVLMLWFVPLTSPASHTPSLSPLPTSHTPSLSPLPASHTPSLSPLPTSHTPILSHPQPLTTHFSYC